MNAPLNTNDLISLKVRDAINKARGNKYAAINVFSESAADLSDKAKAQLFDRYVDEFSAFIIDDFLSQQASGDQRSAQAAHHTIEPAGKDAAGKGQAARATLSYSPPPRSTLLEAARLRGKYQTPGGGATGMRHVAATVIQSYLDSILALDGRPIGDLTAHELRNESVRGAQHAKMCELLVSGMPETGRLRDYKSSDDVKKALDLARKAA